MSQSLEGRSVGKYLLEKKIGPGTAGVLYFALDTFTNQQVTLHVIDKRIRANAAVMESIRSLVTHMSRISHPNVATVMGMEDSEEVSAIAMEVMRGRPITEIVEGRIHSDRELVRIATGILSGLHSIHNEKLLHLSLRPQNILVEDQSVMKIHNISMARYQQSVDMTMMLGKDADLMYEAPEMIKGRTDVGIAADTYSIGMLLYELSAGRPDFAQSRDDFFIRKAIVEGEFPAVDRVNPRLPKPMARVISKAIDRDQSRRFQSALDMLVAMQEAVRVGDTVPSLKPLDESFQPRHQRKYLPLGIVIVCAIVLGIALVVLLGR